MPQPSFTITPFYSLRLRHLVRPRAELWVWCGACRRHNAVDVMDLLAGSCRPDTEVKALERRMRCLVCGHVGFATVDIRWIDGESA